MARSIATETNVAVAVTDGAYVAANPKRLALLLANFTGVRITYSTLGAAVLDQGITVPSGGSAVWLDFAHHGTLVTQAWRSISSGAVAGGVNVIQVLRAE